jgi:hypothetical protein
MAKTVFALLGGALVLFGSFFLSLKLFDYFGLFSSSSGLVVSLTVDGKDSIVITEGGYNLAYRTSGARSCEMTYRNTDDGSTGRDPVPANTSASNQSGLIGDYTLTCIGFDGSTVSKSVRISRAPK